MIFQRTKNKISCKRIIYCVILSSHTIRNFFMPKETMNGTECNIPLLVHNNSSVSKKQVSCHFFILSFLGHFFRIMITYKSFIITSKEQIVSVIFLKKIKINYLAISNEIHLICLLVMR
jgi:hypothetical protein